MKTWRDWFEEHWAGVATAVSVCAALTLAAILALAFNVISTRLDNRPRETARRAGSVSDTRALVSDAPAS